MGYAAEIAKAISKTGFQNVLKVISAITSPENLKTFSNTRKLEAR